VTNETYEEEEDSSKNRLTTTELSAVQKERTKLPLAHSKLHGAYQSRGVKRVLHTCPH
jgi:hypothetical protein